LKATAKATGEVTMMGPQYNFAIIINVPKSTLSQIKRVFYYFDHPSFSPDNERKSNDASSNFKVEYRGWGCLTRVTATLELIGADFQTIDFNMCQSLGAQWLGESNLSVSYPNKPMRVPFRGIRKVGPNRKLRPIDKNSTIDPYQGSQQQ
jgi:hypothetical protein